MALCTAITEYSEIIRRALCDDEIIYASEFDLNDSSRIIYVPASEDDSIINAYKAATGWKEYKAYIYEYDYTNE